MTAAHGMLSLVAPQVREQILTIARTRLAPGGLPLVNYNAMPGGAPMSTTSPSGTRDTSFMNTSTNTGRVSLSLTSRRCSALLGSLSSAVFEPFSSKAVW